VIDCAPGPGGLYWIEHHAEEYSLRLLDLPK
jgi:hypothetical protein